MKGWWHTEEIFAGGSLAQEHLSRMPRDIVFVECKIE